MTKPMSIRILKTLERGPCQSISRLINESNVPTAWGFYEVKRLADLKLISLNKNNGSSQTVELIEHDPARWIDVIYGD